MRLQRHPANPILSPNPHLAWESLVTTNPAAWYDEDLDEFRMLYRAAGDDAEHRITCGLAVSKDGVNFERVSDKPAFEPSEDGWDCATVQDARVFKIGEWHYIFYAAHAFRPGKYWLGLGNRPNYAVPASLEDAEEPLPNDGMMPHTARKRSFLTGVAITKDFERYLRCGYMTDPLTHDHDVIPFPERINGKLYMLRRPLQWCGEEYGCEHPAIWISEGDDLLKLDQNIRMVATGKYEWENGKIGANTVPLKTEHGWLVLTHARGADKLYRLGALLLDLEDPAIVRHRTAEPIMEPEADYEFQDMYQGCLFPCGKVLKDGTLYVYYGAGDKYVGLATVEFEPFMEYMLTCPS